MLSVSNAEEIAINSPDLAVKMLAALGCWAAGCWLLAAG
jgi:hypothetical protein